MAVASRSYYELLELTPAASAEDIKRNFRQQIAKYHPDKVQHLGREFQAMAAERAAELTEAYRILSRPELRADYDEKLGVTPAAASAGVETATANATVEPPVETPTPQKPAADAGHHQPAAPRGFNTGSDHGALGAARATRDRFVRYAAIAKVRDALKAVAGDYEEATVNGFDFAFVPRPRLFARSKGSRLLARFVTHIDGKAVAEAWSQAGRWAADPVCVMLFGGSLSPASELADAITEQRRRTSARVTLVPVDARDWGAHMPADAPPLARDILKRLRSGA